MTEMRVLFLLTYAGGVTEPHDESQNDQGLVVGVTITVVVLIGAIAAATIILLVYYSTSVYRKWQNGRLGGIIKRRMHNSVPCNNLNKHTKS